MQGSSTCVGSNAVSSVPFAGEKSDNVLNGFQRSVLTTVMHERWHDDERTALGIIIPCSSQPRRHKTKSMVAAHGKIYSQTSQRSKNNNNSKDRYLRSLCLEQTEYRLTEAIVSC